MELRTFHGPDLAGLLAAVRTALGENAVIVRTRGPAETDGRTYEVVAAPPGTEQALRRARPVPRAHGGARIIALVGPPGGGKTTTAVKLALHGSAFGGVPVGLITFDTYRAGAIEQIDAYAQAAGLPLEIAYTPEDAAAALERLDDRAAIIVDTPGRLDATKDLEWLACLATLRPDEVHLVLPASMRADVACTMRDAHAMLGTTHVLLTRLDEVAGRTGVRELQEALALPSRWSCDGQRVPHDIRPTTAFAPAIVAGRVARAG